MRQRYSKNESVDRIKRVLAGETIISDAPNSLDGEQLSEAEALSDLAELLYGSLPGKSLTIPSALESALETAGYGNTMVVFSYDGSLAVTTGTSRIYNRLDNDYTIHEVYLSVGEAPTSASIFVDVNNNGTSIFSTRPSIAAGSNTGQSTAISTALWEIGDYLTMDIDQIGSGTAGSNLNVHVLMRKA